MRQTRGRWFLEDVRAAFARLRAAGAKKARLGERFLGALLRGGGPWLPCRVGLNRVWNPDDNGRKDREMNVIHNWAALGENDRFMVAIPDKSVWISRSQQVIFDNS
jgi:hypothetical protein